MVKVVTFQLGKRTYAIDADYIHDMELSDKMSKSILVPDYVKGLDAISGNVVALIDVNQLLFNEETDEPYVGRIIISEDELSKAILVSEVLYIADLEYDSIKSQSNHVYILGKAKIAGKEVLVLNMEKILEL